MANLSRIIGMASKVIDKQLQQRGQGGATGGGQQQAGGTDWRSVVRSAADKLTGDDRGGQPGQQQGAPAQRPQAQQPQQPSRSHGPVDQDKVALAKYDYLLRTAGPEQLEQAHHDAFARLTPEQRQQVLQRMNAELPPHERVANDSAGPMARAMTRGEVGRPGLIRRVLGGGVGGAAVGAGAMALGGIAVAVAGGAVVSAAAAPVLAGAADLGVDFEGIASGIGDFGIADLGEQASGLGEQASGLGEHVSGFGEQASGLGEQASNLGNDFLGGLFDR